MLLLNIIISILLLLNNPLKQEFIRIGPSYLITAFVDRGMVRLYSFHDPSSSRSIPYRVVCWRERKMGNNWKVEGSKSSLSHPMSLECNHKHRYQNDACTLIAFGYLHYGLYIHTNKHILLIPRIYVPSYYYYYSLFRTKLGKIRFG